VPIDLITSLRIAIEIARRLKWFAIAVFYAAGFGVLEARFILVLLPFFLGAALAYSADRMREVAGKDDFRGGFLFYRYGEEITRLALSIPVKEEWDAAETERFAQSLQAELARRAAARLPAEAVQVTGDCGITDRSSGERKSFLRVLVRSRFGSMLTQFAHYASFGRTITAHYFSFIRGTHSDLSVVSFVLQSPFTIWFWGLPWLLNRYSIVAEISKFRKSSFDAIDLQTMYTLIHRVVLEETLQILDAAGLLTEEIKQIIHYHIQNNNNVQNISVSAPGTTIGAISQTVSAPRPAR
jgi:hypothetical protein